MNVLSLFDGMACGLQALKSLGVKVDNYYAAEIDKHAMQIAKKNHPEIQHLGCVTEWESWNLEQKQIDLVIGGSPCQGFSFAGKQLNFSDPRSALFFEFVNILRHIQSFRECDFMLENVRMKKECLDMISQFLEVKPVLINSSLVSAQNRQRYYWCNWSVETPEDRGILLRDIAHEEHVGLLKSHGKWKTKDDKSNCIDANYFKGVDNHGQCTQILETIDDFKIETDKQIVILEEATKGGKIAYIGTDSQGNRVHKLDGKSVTLAAESGGLGANTGLYAFDQGEGNLSPEAIIKAAYIRKLTPIECERLQTLPDDYTSGVSNTQRYKMLGNGWTCEVIKHIFKQNKNIQNAIKQNT